MDRAPSLLLAAVLLIGATAAVLAGRTVGAESDALRGSLLAEDAQTVEAEVLEVAERHGQAAAVVRYDPPVGVTHAIAADGTALPTIEPAYLGALDVAPGQRITVSVPPAGGAPIVGQDHATVAAERLRDRANVRYGAAALGYALAAVLLVATYRSWDGPFIRAETASRHGST